MPNTNGRFSSPKRAILYARVSTEEQAKSGYSLRQQIERLREYAAAEGLSVLEEVTDPGQSGASLERPGMDRVRDLVASEAGNVTLVLAQDRDRFSREPAYTYLLRRELEEHGCALRSLNDRGDDSPEGQLTDGILDQLAKFERAKTAERSRRGKLRKAREGKVIASNKTSYGFRMSESRDGYEVDEAHMAVVGRIFRHVGVEGMSLHRVKKTLEAEGIPAPEGGCYWNKKTLRETILDDVYRPLAFEELEGLVNEGLMASEVAGRLDPGKHYGIWWFNRRRFTRKRVAETGEDGERRYRWRQHIEFKPRQEWIAVPVPDPGIPRAWVEAAREEIKDNARAPAGDYRFWEIAGVFRCGVCGCLMSKTRRSKGRGYPGHYHYYFCPTRTNKGHGACSQVRGFRAEPIEERVWELVRSLMLDPEHLRSDLEAMIEAERQTMRGDPEAEQKVWLDKLAQVEEERHNCIRLAVKGRITDEDLDREVSGLEETRRIAESELRAIEGRRRGLEQLEADRDALLERYAAVAPEALDSLMLEERHQLYKMLRLQVIAEEDRSLTASGVFQKELSVPFDTSV